MLCDLELPPPLPDLGSLPWGETKAPIKMLPPACRQLGDLVHLGNGSSRKKPSSLDRHGTQCSCLQDTWGWRVSREFPARQSGPAGSEPPLSEFCKTPGHRPCSLPPLRPPHRGFLPTGCSCSPHNSGGRSTSYLLSGPCRDGASSRKQALLELSGWSRGPFLNTWGSGSANI